LSIPVWRFATADQFSRATLPILPAGAPPPHPTAFICLFQRLRLPVQPAMPPPIPTGRFCCLTITVVGRTTCARDVFKQRRTDKLVAGDRGAAPTGPLSWAWTAQRCCDFTATSLPPFVAALHILHLLRVLPALPLLRCLSRTFGFARGGLHCPFCPSLQRVAFEHCCLLFASRV